MPSRRRVLMIVQNLPVPFDRRVWLEARALRGAGYQVTVICPKGPGAERSREVLEEIRILRYRAPEARVWRAAFVLEFAWCWLRTFLLTLHAALVGGFDVIHACNPPDTFFAIGLFYRCFGKRFVFDQHDLCPELYVSKLPERQGDLMYRGLVLLERLTYRTADAVIATNDSYREIAIARGGVDPERIFVVRSGPDGERIREEPGDAAERHGASRVIGYLGTMSVQDGVDVLLRVFSSIVHRHGRRDVHLVLVGGGPLLQELRALAQRLGLGDHVTFTGRVPDGDRFRRILCSTDVCVSPDPPNPLNDVSTMNKTMEYMAFGRPVVAYALKETVVSGGDAAVYARPGDEEDFATKIIELLDDPERCRELGRRGKQRVHERLAWERSVPHLLDAYRFVLSPRQVDLAQHRTVAVLALALVCSLAWGSVSWAARPRHVAAALRLRDVVVEPVAQGREIVFGFNRAPGDFNHFRLTQPPRLVIDVTGPSVADQTVQRFPVDDALVSQVRVRHDDGSMRLVLDLKEDGPTASTVREDGRRIVAYLGEPILVAAGGDFDATPPMPAPPAPAAEREVPVADIVLGLGDVLQVSYFKSYVEEGAYHFEVGDGFKVSVADRPELSNETLVLPDGTSTFPLIGSVPVRGMTVREVTAELTRRYAKRLERPQVDVLVTKPRARIDDFFSVLLHSPNGPIQEVTLTNGVVELPMIRSIEARGRTLGDIRRAIQSAYADVLPELRVGVLLLKRAIRSITVLGEVTKGGEFDSPYPISAMRALALAGGVTDRARLTQVLLIRPEADGRLATTILDMKKALDGSDATVGATTVLPNDVLYVPKSKIANVDVFVDQYIRKVLPINPSVGAFTPF